MVTPFPFTGLWLCHSPVSVSSSLAHLWEFSVISGPFLKVAHTPPKTVSASRHSPLPECEASLSQQTSQAEHSVLYLRLAQHQKTPIIQEQHQVPQQW